MSLIDSKFFPKKNYGDDYEKNDCNNFKMF